jgi:hypothetical protein
MTTEKRSVPHAQYLRAIGQSLEMTRVEVFELENNGQSYLVRSRSITPTCQWIINNSLTATGWDSSAEDARSSALKGGEGWLRYELQAVSRLDAQGQKQRRDQPPRQGQTPSKPSQHLRTLGEHLDRVEASAFKISWNPPHSVTIKYQTADGEDEQRTFSFAKLQELGFHMRFRRSSRGR